MSNIRIRNTSHYAPIVVVLILAAGLRSMNTGLEPLSTDEATHSIKAIDVARHGKIELLGPPMPYFSFRGWHGPISIYLYALPFLISPDPRLAIMLTAATHVIATGIIFAIGNRYWGRRTGVISALLFAIHPEAIYMARGIWNPMFMTPFALAYVWSGLLGYCSGHKWARIVHLPMLTLGGQCHPGVFLLAPITIVLWAHNWKQNPKTRRVSMIQTLYSGSFALFLTMPWILGVYLDNVNNVPLSNIQVNEITSSNTVTDDTFTLSMLAHIYQQLGNWETNWTQPIQPSLTIIGLVTILTLALRRQQSVAGHAIGLGYVLPPLIIVVLSKQYQDHFIWANYGFAFLIQGVVASKLLPSTRSHGNNKYKRRIRWIGLLIFALLILTQLLFNFRYDRGLGRGSLDQFIAAINSAEKLSKNTGRNLLMLVADEGLPWEALREGRKARVIWHDRAMPLPQGGAVLLGSSEYDGRPFVFSGGNIVDGGFRITELPPAAQFKPDLIPIAPINFSNGTTVLGFLREIPDSLPQAGQRWTVFMIWRVDAIGTEEYKVFAHLLDETNNKHAQVDVPGLPIGQLRVGEHVMSQIHLEVGDDLPEYGPLYLRFGMYDVSRRNELLGTSGAIQIRSSEDPLADWNNIRIANFVTKNQIQQGPPLEITATWRIVHTPQDNIRLHWSLVSGDSLKVFETTTDLVRDYPATELPSSVLTTERYYLRIPPDIVPATYMLTLEAVDSTGKPIGKPYRTAVGINARARTYTAPPLQHTVNAKLGGKISLLGYDLQSDGATIQITMVWQALDAINADYKYFVHLWRDEQLVTQADAMPRNNQYPTSWWVANEIVTDVVELTVPGPGKYTVTTGLYNPTDDSRLPVILANGQPASHDWVLLEQLLYTE